MSEFSFSVEPITSWRVATLLAPEDGLIFLDFNPPPRSDATSFLNEVLGHIGANWRHAASNALLYQSVDGMPGSTPEVRTRSLLLGLVHKPNYRVAVLRHLPADVTLCELAEVCSKGLYVLCEMAPKASAAPTATAQKTDT